MLTCVQPKRLRLLSVAWDQLWGMLHLLLFLLLLLFLRLRLLLLLLILILLLLLLLLLILRLLLLLRLFLFLFLRLRLRLFLHLHLHLLLRRVHPVASPSILAAICAPACTTSPARATSLLAPDAGPSF